jgi:antitoxin component of RelBE/YafQ-DinJ toxin-antitoxin module
MGFVAKTTSINVRITQEFREEIQALADYNGITLSSMAHSLLVRAVREAREKEPQAFKRGRQAVSVSNKNVGGRKKREAA